MNNEPIERILESLPALRSEEIDCDHLEVIAASLTSENPLCCQTFEKLLSICELISDYKVRKFLCASIFDALVDDVDEIWIRYLRAIINNEKLSWVIAMAYRFEPAGLHRHFCKANELDEDGCLIETKS